MTTQPSNLHMHREGPSVWHLQVRDNAQSRMLGAVGFLMIAGGICCLAQAYKGYLFTSFKGYINPLIDGRTRDTVNSDADDSFPASDPPSWTPSVGRPAHAETKQ